MPGRGRKTSSCFKTTFFHPTNSMALDFVIGRNLGRFFFKIPKQRNGQSGRIEESLYEVQALTKTISCLLLQRHRFEASEGIDLGNETFFDKSRIPKLEIPDPFQNLRANLFCRNMIFRIIEQTAMLPWLGIATRKPVGTLANGWQIGLWVGYSCHWKPSENICG